MSERSTGVWESPVVFNWAAPLFPHVRLSEDADGLTASIVAGKPWGRGDILKLREDNAYRLVGEPVVHGSLSEVRIHPPEDPLRLVMDEEGIVALQELLDPNTTWQYHFRADLRGRDRTYAGLAVVMHEVVNYDVVSTAGEPPQTMPIPTAPLVTAGLRAAVAHAFDHPVTA